MWNIYIYVYRYVEYMMNRHYFSNKLYSACWLALRKKCLYLDTFHAVLVGLVGFFAKKLLL